MNPNQNNIAPPNKSLGQSVTSFFKNIFSSNSNNASEAPQPVNQAPVQQNMQYPVQQAMQYPVQQTQGMMQQNVQQANIFMNSYQNNRNQMYQEQPNQTFNDDQPFVESVKGTNKQGKIDVLLRAQRSQVKLGEQTVMPAMCSLLASGGTRTSVDLICVIDVSGSMQGQKIELVKETMKFLIETLTPNDRLSIITFNSSGRRICPLRTVSQENMVAFSHEIGNLRASGGTNILSGMNLAFQTIRDRRIPNTVTSVFLLSDGQDKGADAKINHALSVKANQELGAFSIHSFGFGTDHDEDLMTNIANTKDGAFYFIKELNTLDEAFCNALGGIISLVATQVNLVVRLIAKDLLQGTRISKVFGDKWQKVNEGEYKIKLTQLMSEVSKDFVFELTFPAIEAEVGDIGREHIIMEAVMQAKGVQSESIVGNCGLSVALINKNEEIAEINQNIDVIENYLRVKASQVIEENMKRAEANQFQEAQKGIDVMINHIQNEKRARKEKMEPLLNDLNLIKQKCQPQVYEYEGRKHMKNAYEAQSRQMNFQYSNKMQTQMVQKRIASKK